MTISPRPSNENFGGVAVKSTGNNNLTGAFNDLATVTITSAIIRHQNHHQQEIPRESKGSLPCNTS